MSDVLTYQEALEIYHTIQSQTDTSDPDIADLYQNLYQRAARYANFRAIWLTCTREERMDTDSNRTSAHDAFITAVDVISRLQKEEGKAWRARLGDDRKRVGDFACYLALFRGLEAR